MPMEKINLRPGVNTEATPLLNEAGWSESNLIRFFTAAGQNFLQKLGGWSRLTSSTFQGICRGLFAWADLSGNAYVAAGTEQRLQVFAAGALFDITPVRKTDNVTPNYSTISGSNIVTIIDTANGASATDGVLIYNPISVGGVVLQGYYEIHSIVDANTYTIIAASNATSTVNNGGAAAKFTTTNTSSTVKVTLNNNGYSVGSVYTVYVATAVGGITMSVGNYNVTTIIDANNFDVAASGTASSSANAFENSGNSRLEYLLPAGLVSAAIAPGYGEGGFGFGPYGQGGANATPNPLRQWSLGAWGEQLAAAPTGGTIYAWDPSLGIPGAGLFYPATPITNAPPGVEGFFIAMPEQQMVAYGATDPGTGNQDPMLIRWCDVANYNQWTASASNQAGSFRLPRGSKIVGGLQGPSYGLLWTDLGLWEMQYVQPPLVYGFNEVAEGCGLISMRAMGVAGVNIFWMSYNGFFGFSAGGGVEPIPCDVFDELFGNIYAFQQDKIQLGVNSHFNEFFTFYPSLTGNGENDSYVKYNYQNGAWDYGSLIRTAWFDQSIFTGNNPMGADTSGLIQQHESNPDADGVPLLASATSGWFKLNDGTMFIFIERMIPDFVLTGNATVSINVITADFPNENAPTVTYGPYLVTNSTEYIIIRCRSRFARVQISSTADFGSFWRLGELIYLATPAGRGGDNQ